MLTCGDLGGQACPLVDEGPCPRGGRIATMPACHPMRMAVALAKKIGCAGGRCPDQSEEKSVACVLAWAAEVRDE